MVTVIGFKVKVFKVKVLKPIADSSFQALYIRIVSATGKPFQNSESGSGFVI